METRKLGIVFLLIQDGNRNGLTCGEPQHFHVNPAANSAMSPDMPSAACLSAGRSGAHYKMVGFRGVFVQYFSRLVKNCQ
jgi:hypothetical protein